MKSKAQSSKHIADISKRKKHATAGSAVAPQLVIPKRSIIVPIAIAETEDSKPSPLEAKAVGRGVQPQAPVILPAEPASTPTPAPGKAEPPTAATPKVPEAQAQVAPETPAANPDPQVTSDDPPDENSASDKPGKTNAHVRKALEDARRQQEIQEYIDNRQFFVPINAVARKRSLKVTIGLTFLELLLGLVLLDLMLDAGVIELIQKIPHTHLFDVH